MVLFPAPVGGSMELVRLVPEVVHNEVVLVTAVLFTTFVVVDEDVVL